MARYINADLIFPNGCVEVSVKGMGDLINHINSIPTAEAVEVVHGEWEEVDKRVKGQKFICSVCKKASYFPQPTRDKSWTKKCPYNYCPNCGAKMDGKAVE